MEMYISRRAKHVHLVLSRPLASFDYEWWIIDILQKEWDTLDWLGKSSYITEKSRQLIHGVRLKLDYIIFRNIVNHEYWQRSTLRWNGECSSNRTLHKSCASIEKCILFSKKDEYFMSSREQYLHKIFLEWPAMLFLDIAYIFMKKNYPTVTRVRKQGPKHSLHKKWSFPVRISSVNVTKSAGNCWFGHIYWRNP